MWTLTERLTCTCTETEVFPGRGDALTLVVFSPMMEEYPSGLSGHGRPRSTSMPRGAGLHLNADQELWSFKCSKMLFFKNVYKM